MMKVTRWRDTPNPMDFYTRVSLGLIPGMQAVHKFGLATDIDTADGEVDVWDGVRASAALKITPYNWIDSGPVYLQISSSSAADVGIVMAGEGLDENWDLATGTVTLNGQTAVPIGLQRNRIFRAYNAGSTYFAGVIYVSDLGTTLSGGVPTDTTKIRAIVHPASQQTQMALYTVPRGYQLAITHGWANIARPNVSTGQAGVVIYRRTYGGVFRTVHTLSLSIDGSSGDHRPYHTPIVFDEKEDLIYRATAGVNDLSISAGFHGILVRK